MNKNPLLTLLGIEHPIIQGPLGGGPSTPELVAAVSNAGGLGSLGAAYQTPDQITDSIKRIRTLSSRPFNVNLFVGGWNTDQASDARPMLDPLGESMKSHSAGARRANTRARPVPGTTRSGARRAPAHL